MTPTLTSNTQAALLLTAPLLVGRGQGSAELLTPSEYRSLARQLRQHKLQPEALLSSDAEEVFRQCRSIVEEARLRRLLERGFLLSQALDRWQTRALWVVSLSDPEYPRRIKERLREDAPPVLYGCGDASLLDRGGLAVVGSRNADDALLVYASEVGRLAAAAHRPVVSGGARGIDQASMGGALNAGGFAVGVLADSLERTAMTREHRNLIGEGQLVLVSPYDPGAGFNVGHAMRRNKLIYALADAALVVKADLEKGGTWNGAVEQLDRLRLVPVYVRPGERPGGALTALEGRGARPWPEPETPEHLEELLRSEPTRAVPQSVILSLDEAQQELLGTEAAPAVPLKNVNTLEEAAPDRTPSAAAPEEAGPTLRVPRLDGPILSPSERLFAAIRELAGETAAPLTEDEFAEMLGVSKTQAREWLKRLVTEGVLVRHGRPARFERPTQAPLLHIDSS